MEGIYAPGRTQRFSVKSVRGDDMPSRCLAVAFDCVYAARDDEATRKAQPESLWGRLVDWAAATWRREAGQDSRSHMERGVLPRDFWRFVYAQLGGGGTWWLFAYDLYPFLCAANFFDEIDDGALHLCLSAEDNGGAVDFGRKRKRQGLLIAENPPTLIVCHRKGGGVLKLIDLANYGLSPSWKPGESVHGKLCATINDYRDLASFVSANGLGALQHTAAAQGMFYYRKSHMSWPIQVHPIKPALDLERAAYYGGRCEAAQLGRLPGYIFHLDVNAQYTYCALTQDFPAQLMGYNETVPLKDFFDLVEGGGAIADVTVRIVEPVAPIRCNERTLFPVGTFRTTLCQPEIELAMEYGEIVACHQLAIYGVVPLFRTFANSMRCLKTLALQLGNDNMLSLVKSMANGMYGKWGQKAKRWLTQHERINGERWEQWWEPHPWTDDPVPWRALAGIVQYQDSQQEGKLACPMISAFMCAYGRVFLWRVMQAAGIDNVFYWDTDSVMVNEEGFDRLAVGGWLDENTVGKLKLREHGDKVDILGVKHYQFGPRYCCSGVSQETEERLHGSVIVSEHVGFSQGLWHKERGVSRRITRKVGRKRKYNQGRVIRGGRVIPYNFTSRKQENAENGETSV